MEKLTKEILKIWEDFRNKFTPAYILNEMTMEEYVIGMGSDNKSFCYIVERELDALGSIRGSSALKFELYYGRTKNDSEKRYRIAKLYGNSIEEVFEELKRDICNIIIKSIEMDEFKDIDCKLSYMFKHKIMYLYHPEIMIPIFSDESIRYFCKLINPKFNSKSYEEAQRCLMDYKKINYSEMTNHEFACYLYKTHNKPITKKEAKANEDYDDKLNKDITKKKIDINNLYENNTYVPKPEKKAEKKFVGKDTSIYPRDPKKSAFALFKANYKCENVESHECFIRRKNNTPYTEVHHLIPLCYQDDFEYSLDEPANIVSLCSNCHNEIHYGKEAKKIIERLYNLRKEELCKAGIDCSLERLFKMYENINK